MLDYTDSPPPLHHSPATSDKSRFPSRDSTPVTPVGFGPSIGKKPDKDACLPWFKKPIDVGKPTTRLCLDTTLLEPDFDDHSFPLFGSSPPDRSMAGAAAPINISARHASTSPRGHQASNLTSALQKTDSGDKRAQDVAEVDKANHSDINRRPSTGEGLSHLENGGRPINGASGDKLRRESIAQSMNTGMSWGGISVGSWIRDECVISTSSLLAICTDLYSVMMSGTSPFTFHQSPSYHSSSYLPKLEANFMRDFSCCGLILPSLHDLLQHYEEAHAEAQKSSQQNNITNDESVMPDSRAAIATNTAASVVQEAQRQQQYSNFKPIAPAQAPPHANTSQTSQQRPSGFSSTLQTIPDMDTVEDMEMDDVEEMDEKTPPPNLYTKGATQQSPRAQFNAVAQPRAPQLNMNMNMMQSQALRNSTPSTPTTQGRGGVSMYNNPSTSAVNTPTLTGNPMQQQFQNIHDQQYHATPDSSAPGTPAELDENIIEGMDDMSMQNNPFYRSQSQNFNYGGFGNHNDMLDLCIDEPAKHLFSTTGGFNPQTHSQGHVRLASGQYGPNSDLARRIREQQMLAGLADTTTGLMPHDEPKPFRCPVIGCEKAYKNQNGLKYHKSVSIGSVPGDPFSNNSAARSQQSTTPRQCRWHVLDSESRNFCTIPRDHGHGKGETIQMRSVR